MRIKSIKIEVYPLRSLWYVLRIKLSEASENAKFKFCRTFLTLNFTTMQKLLLANNNFDQSKSELLLDRSALALFIYSSLAGCENRILPVKNESSSSFSHPICFGPVFGGVGGFLAPLVLFLGLFYGAKILISLPLPQLLFALKLPDFRISANTTPIAKTIQRVH